MGLTHVIGREPQLESKLLEPVGFVARDAAILERAIQHLEVWRPRLRTLVRVGRCWQTRNESSEVRGRRRRAAGSLRPGQRRGPHRYSGQRCLETGRCFASDVMERCPLARASVLQVHSEQVRGCLRVIESRVKFADAEAKVRACIGEASPRWGHLQAVPEAERAEPWERRQRYTEAVALRLQERRIEGAIVADEHSSLDSREDLADDVFERRGVLNVSPANAMQ